MASLGTHLRHIIASDAELLERTLESLPFKVEIKGGPILNEGDWWLWFTIDESDKKALRFQSGRIEA